MLLCLYAKRGLLSLEFLLKHAKEIAAATVFSAGLAISGCSIPNKYEDMPEERLSSIARHDLNMRHPYRFFKEDLEKVLNAPNEEGDIALIILPRSDHNGAFANTTAKERFSDIIQRYRTFAYEVDNEQEIVDRMKEVGKYGKISFLMLCGHGEKSGIELDDSGSEKYFKTIFAPFDPFSIKERNDVLMEYEKSRVDIGDVQSGEINSMANYLADDALIFLSSCSVGEGGNSNENFASALANCLKSTRCRVVASQSSFCSKDIQFFFEDDKLRDIIIRNGDNTLKLGYIINK